MGIFGASLLLSSCGLSDHSIEDRNPGNAPISMEATEIASEECEKTAIVRVLRGQYDCEYVFFMEDRRLFTPLNAEDIPFKLYSGQKIRLSLDPLNTNNRDCLDAVPAFVKCASIFVEGEHRDQPRDSAPRTE